MIANTIVCGDALETLKTLPDNCIQMVCTSPPYWSQRDYNIAGQLGLEDDPFEYIAKLVVVFREVRRVLKPDGTCWVNLGDSYFGDSPTRARAEEKFSIVTVLKRSAGVARRSAAWQGPFKPKDLMLMPPRVAMALQDDGWWIRNDVIWQKANPMPSSVRDRLTNSYEHLFLLTKSARYYYSADAIREPHTSLGRPPGNKSRMYLDRDPKHHTGEKRRPDQAKSFHPLGRNRRDVWTISTQANRFAHFAVMPEKLVEPCILAGSRPGDLILDPFAGSGTVPLVAKRLGRNYYGIDLNSDYVMLSQSRLASAQAA